MLTNRVSPLHFHHTGDAPNLLEVAMFLTRCGLLIALFVITFIAAGGPALAQPSSDTAAVTAANEAFYAALSSLDVSATESLWVQDSYVTWIGPRSRAAEVGWSAVQGNLKFFGERFAQMSIKPVNVQVTVGGPLAWVVGGEVQQGILKDGRVINNTTLVTNIFEKRDGRWLLVAHHAHVLSP
jgi:ketosteroid isomerase-like protein